MCLVPTYAAVSDVDPLPARVSTQLLVVLHNSEMLGMFNHLWYKLFGFKSILTDFVPTLIEVMHYRTDDHFTFLG